MAQPEEDQYPADFEDISAALSEFADVLDLPWDLCTTFSAVFCRLFLTDYPQYNLLGEIDGGTRSNWTYHTALAMGQTARFMNLTCRFEVGGKRDAIIETRDTVPEPVLIAEWEWDGDDVFGAGKELEKLRDSCSNHKNANALLLTYCESRVYVAFLRKIVEFWIGAHRRQSQPPTLFLHTVTFEKRGGMREFDLMRSVSVTPEAVLVWSDDAF